MIAVLMPEICKHVSMSWKVNAPKYGIIISCMKTHTTHINVTGIDVVMSTVWYIIEWLQSDPVLIIWREMKYVTLTHNMCLAGGICAAGVLAHREWCWGTGCIACSLHDWRQSLIAHSHLSSNSTWKKQYTWSHMMSHGLTWCHMVSHGLTWCHMVCRKETLIYHRSGNFRVVKFLHYSFSHKNFCGLGYPRTFLTV